MQQAVAIGRPSEIGEARRRPRWRIRLRGSETNWAIAFIVPYAAVFVVFVVYPVAFGFWSGSDPALFATLFSDPLYLNTVVNTLVFVGISVNVMMFLAFLLSGFFMSQNGWVRSLLVVFLLPWALPGLVVFTSIHLMLVTQWGLVDSLWRAISGSDGPLFLTTQAMAVGSTIVSHIWKWMPFWTLIFLAARMAIPKEIYEAADVDGATSTQRAILVTLPLLANVYLISTLLCAVWTISDYATVYLVSSGAPARWSDVLATYSFKEALDFGYPDLGFAAMLSALPVLIPLVILLMRHVHLRDVQL